VKRRRARRRLARVVITVALATFVVAVGVILAVSPRHRAFYLGNLGRATEAARVNATAENAAARGPGRGARHRTTVRVTVPTQDAQGRVRVPVADVVPWALPAEGVPAGWDLKEFAGKPEVELVRADGRLALRLRSESSSFALYRDVVVDPNAQPRLAWSWKVMRLPIDGDARHPARNDQAAGVYVVFPRWPAPITTSAILGYVWDTAAPVGTVVTVERAPNVRLIVVQSGVSGLKEWRRYDRDLARDYAAVFGAPPGRVGKLALMTDADDTRGLGEVFIADLLFQRR
jgi:Protein of unknown function (DUF3047)